MSVPKPTVLGVFDFRAFLDIAMLLSESEKARAIRQVILDVVIDLINRKNPAEAPNTLTSGIRIMSMLPCRKTTIAANLRTLLKIM